MNEKALTSDNLRWLHMTPEELLRELSLRTDLTSLETVLLSNLRSLLEDSDGHDTGR